MSTPVVVQGTAVSSPHQQSYDQSHDQSYGEPSHSGDANFTKGEKQESKCRDPIFAFILYGNIIAIAVTVGFFWDDAKDIVNGTGEFQYEGYIWAALVCGVFTIALSFVMLLVMMRIPTFLIKTALIFVVVMSGVWAVLGFIYGNIIMGIFGVIFFLIGMCYARAVWSRIPFASANLLTGCTSIKNNFGVVFISFLFVALALGWTFLWSLAFVGLFQRTYTCQTVNGVEVCSGVNYGYLFLLLVSYFFTHQVIQNTVHVIVAGTVGSWWFDPDSNGCCGGGVVGSTVRALTTSFGSICLGSLIVAIVQALRALANEARQNGDAGILACLAECILACIQGIIEYFNKWAFVYVGLYGYGYLEAGKNVITLFKNRGWDAIITDDLIGNVLLLVSIIVGAISGVVAIIIEQTSEWFENSNVGGGNTTAIAFGLGFLVGVVLCAIFLSSIASSVNTVIVLFAEAPAEFERNYPDLSRQMREAWRGAFPGSV